MTTTRPVIVVTVVWPKLSDSDDRRLTQERAMSSSARILILAMFTIVLTSPFGLQAAHADWRCHIHPNVAVVAETSGMASEKDGANNHPSESSHFSFGKIEQTYRQQK
jgi:hypothetical protein